MIKLSNKEKAEIILEGTLGKILGLGTAAVVAHSLSSDEGVSKLHDILSNTGDLIKDTGHGMGKGLKDVINGIDDHKDSVTPPTETKPEVKTTEHPINHKISFNGGTVNVEYDPNTTNFDQNGYVKALNDWKTKWSNYNPDEDGYGIDEAAAHKPNPKSFMSPKNK